MTLILGPGSSDLRFPSDHYYRGLAWSEKNEYDKAIAEYTENIRIDPAYVAAYHARGCAWSAKNEHDKAIADFTEAIRLSPTYAAAYCGRGWAWGAKRDIDKAMSDFTEAIRLNPKFSVAYYNRGIAWVAKKELDEGITDFTSAVRVDAKNIPAFIERGNIWFSKREFDKAIADYNEAIRLAPQLADAYNNRAWLLATCPNATYRDGKRAIESASKACELTQWKLYRPIGTLAAAYAEAGDFEAAVKWQSKAIELATDEVAKDDHRTRLKLYQAKELYREAKP